MFYAINMSLNQFKSWCKKFKKWFTNDNSDFFCNEMHP